MVTTLQSVLATLLIGVISAIAWKLWMNFRAMQRAHSEKINSVLGDLSARFPVPGSEVPRSASSPDLPSLCPSGSAPAAAVGPAPVSDKSCSTSRVGQLPAAVGSAPTPGSASAPLSTVLTAPVNVTSNAPAPPSAPAVPTAPTAGASARSSVPVTIPQELIDPEDVEDDRARLEALLPALDPAKMRAAVGARPREPGMEECCGSGCVNCVLDVYATRLDRWRERRERYLALIEPPLRVSSDANDEHGDAAVCKGPGQVEQGTVERKYDA